MAVNENCREISYVLGRLFSVLENIQMQANPNINTTIKERYFNSACATPASVFPTLLKLANAHMDKLKDNTPASIFFKKKIGSLMEKITMPDEGTPLPNRLSLEEQGAFVLGYYQETQARYAGKRRKTEMAEAIHNRYDFVVLLMWRTEIPTAIPMPAICPAWTRRRGLAS